MSNHQQQQQQRKPRVIPQSELLQRTRDPNVAVNPTPPVRRPGPQSQSQSQSQSGQAKIKDIRQTKEYRVAARRWTSTIVALPILLYTSYILYERAYGNQSPKHLAQTQNLDSNSNPSSSPSPNLNDNVSGN